MQIAKLLPKLILLVLLSAAFVESGRATQTPSETSQDDADLEGEMFNRRFVKALFGRVERALLEEREQYDDRLVGIYAREEELKERLAETLEKKRLTQQKLDFKKSEHKELRNKLRKATNDDEKAEILERLAAVSKELDEAEAVVVKLKSDEKAIKETLDFRTGPSFSSKGALIKQRDQINEIWSNLTYKKLDWEAGYSRKHFLALKNSLVKTAEAAGLICNVTMVSESDSGETTGASIKYLTDDQRHYGAGATLAKCSTRCLEPMKPGLYYVWTERNNKPTSDPNARFQITSEHHNLTLREYPIR